MTTRSAAYRSRALFAPAIALMVAGIVAARGTLAQDGSRGGAAQNGRPLSIVLAAIGNEAGVPVLCDSAIGGRLVSAPAGGASADTVERQIMAVVAELPQGATWVKLYLPPPSGQWNGDTVAQYAFAQARMLNRRIGAPTRSDMVEILGQSVPPDKARDIIATLGLRKVYLVVGAGGAAAGGAPTPDQIQQFGNMDQAGKMQIMQAMQQQMIQQGQMMKLMFSQMSDADRQQFSSMLGANGLAIRIKTAPGPNGP